MCVFIQHFHHEKDATQGQLFEEYNWFEFSVFFFLDELPYEG